MEKINRELAGIPLSKLGVEEYKDYIAVEREFDPQTHRQIGTSCRYGFDRLVLSYEDKQKDGLYIWGVRTFAFPLGQIRDDDAFLAQWRTENPDYVLRVLQHRAFENADAFLALYHKKDAVAWTRRRPQRSRRFSESEELTDAQQQKAIRKVLRHIGRSQKRLRSLRRRIAGREDRFRKRRKS